MQYIKPAHLRPGDTVGIVSPSSTIAGFPRRLRRGIEALEALGLKVILAPNCKAALGHLAGTPQQRADDIHTLFSDTAVKAIICSTGGYNANAVLPLLDYELIKTHPKIFCGYSDITALNLAITHKSGLITFNGPTVLPTFGEFGGPLAFTKDSFEQTVFRNRPVGRVPYSTETSDENLWWDKEDDRPRAMQPSLPPKTICGGSAQGILLGGNLETLTLLGGTDYLPDFRDTILFLEEMEGGTDSVERNLNYLEQLGIFDRIKGLVFGKPYDFSTISSDRSLETVLQEIGQRYNIPVITDVDCGHTSPMLTLPLGVQATLQGNTAELIIDEAATS